LRVLLRYIETSDKSIKLVKWSVSRLSEQPLVSVVMPNLNNAPYIRQAIQSVLSQKYRNLELIVVDDGSHDDSVNTVQALQESNENIRLLTTAGGRGSATARNVGILNAKGDFVSFLDSDDIWSTEKLDKQIKAYYSARTPCIVYCDWFRIDELGNMLPQGRLKKPRSSGNIFSDALETAFGASSMFLIPKVILKKVGLFDENLRWAEDLDFTLRLARTSTFLYLDEKLYGYRIHARSKGSLIPRMEKLLWESLVIRRHYEIGKALLNKESKGRVISLLTQYYFKTRQYKELLSLYATNPDNLKILFRSFYTALI
jgi:glycosyltransferase involved in cell wall biosynthesis